VAELLKKAGYTTACIGKWHLGDQPEFMPRRRGFDYYFGLPYSNDMGTAEDGSKSSLGEPIPVRRAKPSKMANQDDETGLRGLGQPPLPLVENEKVVERVRAAEQQTLVQRYTQKAVEFIRANQGRRFFVYLPHNAVHFPHYPGKEFQGKSANGNYGDWVEEVDWSVGQILDTLRSLKLAEKTLVIFTSDNGGTPRAVNSPFRGYKGSTWEGGMREPTIAWWPGRVPAGTATDEIVGMIDILPTLVKLAGGTVPADRKIDGADIWPLLSGQPGEKSPHEVFYYYKGLKLEAVRTGTWKLHLAKTELYDLAADIGESKNVADSHPDVVKRLRELADGMRGDLGVDGMGPGCHELGRVAHPQPLIGQDGKVREGF
jgi:arylsulfatase A-like enzyme